MNDQTDTDKLVNSKIYLLINQNQSQDTFHKQKISDAVNFKNESINVYIQTDFDSSTEAKISANHTF